MSEENKNLDLEKLIKDFQSSIEDYLSESSTIYPYDIKELLLQIRDNDEQLYYSQLKIIPNDLFAEILSEMPSYLQEEVSNILGIKKLVKITTEMDTDDAADFIQNIKEGDRDKAEDILISINPVDQKIIRSLISYEDNLAGAYMQQELFFAKKDEIVGDSIIRLRKEKIEGNIDSISHVFIIEKTGVFICSIALEELILLDPSQKFESLLELGDIKVDERFVNHLDDIRDVVVKVSDYNLSVIPVVDDKNVLVGRITSDDVYDLIEEQGTEDMFSMAGLNIDAEERDDLNYVAKQRALWLCVNLVTAIAASVVIGLYDSTLQSYIALAILMPIVASMGGNAGTQSLTVTVRQLSLGRIDSENAYETIKKEIFLSLINGFIFSFVIGIISHFWFKIPYLGVVIALSIIINLFLAGLCGAIIPLTLDKMKIDPAIASTVLLTTITDIIGFFSFLGLAKIMLG